MRNKKSAAHSHFSSKTFPNFSFLVFNYSKSFLSFFIINLLVKTLS
jgi:hypothetical protein